LAASRTETHEIAHVRDDATVALFDNRNRQGRELFRHRGELAFGGGGVCELSVGAKNLGDLVAQFERLGAK
jgi:hypothetical protein